MKVRYTPESLEDIQRVVEFINIKNPFAARRIAIDIQEGVARLKHFPEIGLTVSKFDNSERIRDLFAGNYIIRYLLTPTTIHILRVWNSKENERNLE